MAQRAQTLLLAAEERTDKAFFLEPLR